MDNQEQKTEELNEVEQRMYELEAKAEENFKGWQRAAADLENFKRRADERLVQMVAFGQDQVIATFLGLYEDMERLLKNLPERGEDLQDWRVGAEGVKKRFEAALRDLGVERIPTEGEKFDLNLHEAVEMIPGGDEEMVAEEVAAGYKREERVFRPAQVKVYKGKN